MDPFLPALTKALLGAGLLGFLGLSILCPLAAIAGSRVFRRGARKRGAPSPRPPRLIEVVIPARDEEALIGATLESIRRSVARLQSQAGPRPDVRIRVIADGCSDGTVKAARRFPGVEVEDVPRNRGKWASIQSAFRASASDWLILVDAGTLWPDAFLSDVVRTIARTPRAIALAPAYRPLLGGWLHRVHWTVEKTLKRMETACGGPVSLHGATIAYRTAWAKRALRRLGDTQWLNDDVVLPLALRTFCPQGVILYPVGEVRDAGIETGRMDLGRRKRMMAGNLQWIKGILPASFRRNPVAATVALRRLFRLFWAYWLAFLAAGLALAFQSAILPALAAGGILLAVSRGSRQLAAAAMASFLAPFGILTPGLGARGTWK